VSKTRIELVIRVGDEFTEIRVPVDVSAQLLRELSEPVELSDAPFALLLASPGMWGGRGDAITVRKKAFAMRKDTASEISDKIVNALVKFFGRNDKTDGYSSK